MRRNWWCGAALVAVLLVCSEAFGEQPPKRVNVVIRSGAANVAESSEAMVATVHPLATQAGFSALEAGGNAVDAAVAAALTLGVVDGHNSGVGGGCLILVRTPQGAYVALDGREVAPAAATRDMFLRDGKAVGEWSQTGALAVAVPGALAAYDELTRKYGRRPLSSALQMAAQIADEGFAIDANYADKLRRSAVELARFPGSAAVLLRSSGEPYRAGEILRQPDLAATYRAVATEGVEWFYRGPFAERIERWMIEQRGLVRKSDFVAYRAKWRTPLAVDYRGYRVVGFPPPSSGGVHVAQMLKMLEALGPAEPRKLSEVDRVHRLAEVMKLAFADRAYWLGDPDFAPVPKGLINDDYLRGLAAKVRQDRASSVPAPGAPPNSERELFERHTTHIAAADAEGWWVGITATVNTTFGSKVIVPGTGVVLNNEMDDFSIQPGVPNAFGLVGAEANAVAPGKRPLSSMSPTIVERNGKPVFTVGAAGGPTIITQVLLAVTRVIDQGQGIDEALAGGRFHHQWRPDRLRIERGLATPELIKRLEEFGHRTEVVDGLGVSQAIQWDEPRGRFIGVREPRLKVGVARPSIHPAEDGPGSP